MRSRRCLRVGSNSRDRFTEIRDQGFALGANSVPGLKSETWGTHIFRGGRPSPVGMTNYVGETLKRPLGWGLSALLRGSGVPL